MSTLIAKSKTRRWRLPIAAYLSIGLGGLTFIVMATVMWFMLAANFRNTSELLADKARLLIGSLVEHTERFLDPALAQVEFIAQQLENDAVSFDEHERLFDLMHAVLAATPQTHSLILFDADGAQLAVIRGPAGIERLVEDWSLDPGAAAAVAQAEERGEIASYWGPPVYVPEIPATVVNLRRPIRRDGVFIGAIAATLTVTDLSHFIAELETETGQNAFILYDRDYVLAHRALEQPFPGLSDAEPLPKVRDIGDPVLFGIWEEDWQDRILELTGFGHWGQVGNRQYIYLYEELDHYADQPWLVGSYFAEDAIDRQVDRLAKSGMVGLAGLLVVVAAAVAVGWAVRGPIARLAEAAAAIRRLDLDRVPALPPSRFRELDDASGAFNAMVAGLKAFALYVPRNLVLGLLDRGDVAALPSENREVTVLFTDIAGFTARTEQLGARETADFLNHHFGMLIACIEAEGGTVDKFIGDAVMALWGAVEVQPDHAVRATRAARAIAAAIRQDNLGVDQPVRVRLGLHSGPVVVGNIGTPTRMNYTVVGDTVNIAQRLEGLAKTVCPEAEVAILMSADTAAALPPDTPVTAVGSHQLRGRGSPTEVFTLAV